MKRNGILILPIALLFTAGGVAQSASPDPASKPTPGATSPATTPKQPTYRWYVKASQAVALYRSKATVSAAGTVVPGASAKVTNQPLELIDVGYHVTPNIAVNFMTGIPAKPKITATGAIATYGTLGHVLYGPGVLSMQYQEKHFGRFQPYAGGGAVYAIMLKNYDAAIEDLKVKNHWGSAVLGGADYMFTPRLGAFVEGEQLWLSANARGNIAGVVPATAHVQLNPTKIALGVKYCF